MTFTKFNFVEEYLELIAGKRDLVSRKQLYHGFKPIVDLANYDVSVVDSLSDRTLKNIPLTEKQAALAVKIILKYEKQLRKKGIEISVVLNPKFRVTPIASISVKKLYLENNKLFLNFPYIEKLINEVKKFRDDSQGKVQFNTNIKLWEIDNTEYNLNWAYAFAVSNNFEIDENVTDIMNKILEVENLGFEIQLSIEDNKLIIKNAADSLVNYIENNLGGFELSNAKTLVDYSGILGYIVNENCSELKNLLPSKFVENKSITIPPSEDFGTIIDYAITANRLPIIVYCTSIQQALNNLVATAKSRFNEDEIYILGFRNPRYKYNPPSSSKIIFCDRVLKFNEHKNETYKLFVTTHAMMFGADKTLWLSNAERIIYYTEPWVTFKRSH